MVVDDKGEWYDFQGPAICVIGVPDEREGDVAVVFLVDHLVDFSFSLDYDWVLLNQVDQRTLHLSGFELVPIYA